MESEPNYARDRPCCRRQDVVDNAAVNTHSQ